MLSDDDDDDDGYYETLIGSIRVRSDDLEWPLTPISTSRQYSTLNISETTRESHYRTSI